MEDEVKLSQTGQWYRSVLYGVLAWGGTVLLVFAGWIIGPGEIASFDPPIKTCEGQKDKLIINAWFLSIVVPLVVVTWALSLEKFYKLFPEHPTKIRITQLRTAYGVIGA